MQLVSKAKHFFSGAALRPKAASTDSPRSIPHLEIRRDQADWRPKSRRAPPPPPTLWLQDIGLDVHACLQHKDIVGLDFRDNGAIVAVSKLSKKALDPIVRAIGILVESEPRDEDRLRAACTLVRMLEPSVRLLLPERCPEHLDVLVKCEDAAMDRALYVACRDALGCKDFSRFLKLLSYCSPQARASLSERFPPLTLETAKALDEKTLIKAVDVTVHRLMKRGDREEWLTELDSLLSIADDLKGADLPRAVVMKCIVWESLSTKGVPDPVVFRKLKDLQYKAFLPALPPELVKRLQDELKLDIPGVVEEQGKASLNVKEGMDRLPATPFYEFFGFEDAMEDEDLNKAASLIHDSSDPLFRAKASGTLSAAVSQKLILGLAQQIERKEAEAKKQEASVELEMAAVLVMTGESSLTGPIETILSRVDSEPGQFIQVLLEGLGFPGHGGPLRQMIAALPTLCDDHSFALDFILRTDQGKELVAQAAMGGFLEQRYSNAIVASLVLALADRVDLRSFFLQEIGPLASKLRDSAMTMVIELLISGVPHETEAAEKILSLVQESKIAGESLRAQMRDLLPTLCDADHAIERDFILKTKLGERLVAQAVEDYLLQGDLNVATVASLFKAFAHHVDLRTTELFSIDFDWYMEDLRRPTPTVSTLLLRLAEDAQLDEERLRECTEDLREWRPGWRLLLLPCLPRRDDLFASQFKLGVVSVFSAKAFDAAATDGILGGVAERMTSPLLSSSRVFRYLPMMLSTSVAGKPLFSDEALVNVMRAIVSDKGLIESTLGWAETSNTDTQKRFYKAMASALISLQSDPSPSRFDNNLLAKHAVAYAATQMERTMRTMPPPMKKNFEKEEWWGHLVSLGLLSAGPAPKTRIQIVAL